MFDLLNKKDRKRLVLKQNREAGELAENMFVMSQIGSGNEVIRTGKGHDFKVRKRDPFTGRVIKTEYAEIKSSRTAPVSKLQKKTKKKLKGRHKVVRFGYF